MDDSKCKKTNKENVCKKITYDVGIMSFNIYTSSLYYLKKGIKYLKKWRTIPAPQYNISRISLCDDENGDIVEMNIYNVFLKKWKPSHRLEIEYEIKERTYIIVYTDKNQINFPIYSEQDLARRGFKNGVLFAKNNANENDMTPIMQKYAGPLGDFYKSLNNGVVIKKEWIESDSNVEINVTDKSLNERVFKNGDIIQL